LERFGDSTSILKASRAELQQVHGIGPELADGIVQWEKQVDLSAEIKRIEQSGCRIVIQSDENYPPLLKQIYDPPVLLYVLGELTLKDRNAVAMVGSRQTTHYGIEIARKLGYQLAYTGVTVVSGGARGIDTAAHQGALSAKGRTIAVLGTGINLVFPAENGELFQRIAAQGALVSQFPFNRPADKQTFPIRNRIVAGMTLGTVVVEANLTSGALITAGMAVDYGRQVFAVPGRVDSPRSKGCHDLIKKGAKLCEGVEDILGEFEYMFPESNRSSVLRDAPSLPAITLSEVEQVIYDIIDKNEISIDDIIRQTGLPSSTVSVALLGLEMKRLVRQLPGKLFLRNK
jgi:DNA processing protein